MNKVDSVALELTGISKSYGGISALKDGNLRVLRGSIHGLVGPNGAGKSTLIKVASGLVRRDTGSIRVMGAEADLRGVPDALAAGIVAMPQELTIVPGLSAAENITLGLEPARWGVTSQERIRAAARMTIAKMAFEVNLDTKAQDLDPATQRVVMLGRALHTGAHTLILDEPTAALNAAQAEVFLRVVEGLREAGFAIVYISHRFNEVERLCDEVTILRDGATVDSLPKARCTQDELVSAVVQDAALTDKVSRRNPARMGGTPAVQLRKVTGSTLQSLDLEIPAGEVLGLCGLPGSGVTELMEILGGVRAAQNGSIAIAGKTIQPRDPADTLAAGLTYLPVERTRAGMVEMSIRANLVTSSLSQIGKLGMITTQIEDTFSRSVITNLGLEKRVAEPLKSLSGGNRQKVLLGRCLLTDAKAIVLDDPTVGVDVRARSEIHELLGKIADQGRSVIMAVSEPEELLSVADRVLVLNRGIVVAELRGAEITSEAMLRASTTGTLRREAA